MKGARLHTYQPVRYTQLLFRLEFDPIPFLHVHH